MAQKKNNFPWGLALLGIGAYLFFRYRNQHQVVTTIAPGEPSGQTTATLLPGQTATTLPASMVTPDVLQTAPSTTTTVVRDTTGTKVIYTPTSGGGRITPAGYTNIQ